MYVCIGYDRTLFRESHSIIRRRINSLEYLIDTLQHLHKAPVPRGGNLSESACLFLYLKLSVTMMCIVWIAVMVKTEDIHPPKTGISVHFCVLSLMAMQN